MSIGSNQPFRPAGTVSLSAGTASSAVALSGGGESVVVTNAAQAVAFVTFGPTAAVTATTAGMPVLPGGRVLLAAHAHTRFAAAVLASGSGSLYFTLGDGSVV